MCLAVISFMFLRFKSLLTFLDMWVYNFPQILKIPAIIFSSIYRILPFWHSNSMYVRLLEVVPQLTDALSCFHK